MWQLPGDRCGEEAGRAGRAQPRGGVLLEGPVGPRLEGPGAEADCGPGREPFSPPRPPVPATHLPRIKQTMAVQPEPFRLSFQLKRRSSRSKRWGKSDCISRATNPRPQGGRSSTLPTLEPVQLSSAEGNWLMGVTTRWSGWGRASGRPYSIPWGCGRWKMHKVPSKASMVWLCRCRWVGSSACRLRWCWWYRTRSWGRADMAGHRHVGLGQEPGSWQDRQRGKQEALHLLLQAAHHSGQQPCLPALLGVGDEEVHVVALRGPV